MKISATYLSKHFPSLEATLDEEPVDAHEAAVRTLVDHVEERDLDDVDHAGLPGPWPRVRQDSEAKRIQLTDLSAEWAERLVAIEGSIATAGPLLEHSLSRTYECQRCGYVTELEQPILPTSKREPDGCPKCEKKTTWDVDHDQLIDHRKARLAPRVGEGTGNMDAHPLLLVGPLARGLTPGEEVTVHGYTILVEEGDGFRLLVVATDVEHRTARDREKADGDDLERWRRVVDEHGDELARRVAETITPHHFGDQAARESMALSLFSRKGPDRHGDRDALHVLLVGDPSTGKSRLLRSVAERMPKAMHVNAKQATRAGLTATVAKDKEMGGHRLEPGAFVLSSGGACMIDELDKAPEGELTALHEAMAQLTVSISMAGNTATLPAHASVVAAANPTNLRWDRNEPVADQIDLPATILSRFDAIHLFADRPDEERDREIASKILEDEHEADHGIPPELVARVAWTLARDHDVHLPGEVREYLEDAFVEIRQSHDGGRIPMGQRQLASMKRFCEAHARMHLREEATVLDAEWAASHVEAWVRMIARDALGQRDIDMIEAPKAKSQRERVRLVLDTLREHGPLTQAELENRLDLDRVTVEKTVETLQKDGSIYRPDGEAWTVVQ